MCMYVCVCVYVVCEEYLTQRQWNLRSEFKSTENHTYKQRYLPLRTCLSWFKGNCLSWFRSEEFNSLKSYQTSYQTSSLQCQCRTEQHTDTLCVWLGRCTNDECKI